MTAPSIEAACDQLLAQSLTVAPAGTTRIIGIDGPSGAGKTTFSELLAAKLLGITGTAPQVVHMDDVYAGWSGLAKAVDIVASCVLEPLLRGHGGTFRRWDWARAERADTIDVPAAEWIILEGVGSGSRRCRPHLAALAWMEADRAVRMARGLERDGDAFRTHWELWSLQEETLFAAEDTRHHATVHIET